MSCIIKINAHKKNFKMQFFLLSLLQTTTLFSGDVHSIFTSGWKDVLYSLLVGGSKSKIRSNLCMMGVSLKYKDIIF